MASNAAATKAATKTATQKAVAVQLAKPIKFGGRTIVVDENLSPLIATELEKQGYGVKTFNKGTLDADIIKWAKENNGAVLTNNIKDFKGQGIMTIEVPTQLTPKSKVPTIIDRINVINNIMESNGSGVYSQRANINLEKDAAVQH